MAYLSCCSQAVRFAGSMLNSPPSRLVSPPSFHSPASVAQIMADMSAASTANIPAIPLRQ